MSFYRAFRPFIFMLPPECAHNLGLWALSAGLMPGRSEAPEAMLAQQCFGLDFAAPVGLAAGFDKNAKAVDGLLKQGFGFVECGTVTPKAQPGNPTPRVFRLLEDEALINRLGFNNEGLDVFVRKFSARTKTLGVAGANIGKNKDSSDAVADYVTGLAAVYPHADYVTVNISSPNTQGLRDLQQRDALHELLSELKQERAALHGKHGRRVPLLLKVAPDLTQVEREAIAEVVTGNEIDGLIVSNTTLARPQALQSSHCKEAGGLSGKPLMDLSTQGLAAFYRLVGGRMPLIGVGGVASAQDAYRKVRAGASLVQIYSALAYQGFGLVRSIHRELPALLKRDGYRHLRDAVGADVH